MLDDACHRLGGGVHALDVQRRIGRDLLHRQQIGPDQPHQRRIADAGVFLGLRQVEDVRIDRRRCSDVVLAPHRGHARLGPAIAFAGVPAELAQHSCDFIVTIARGHARD